MSLILLIALVAWGLGLSGPASNGSKAYAEEIASEQPWEKDLKGVATAEVAPFTAADYEGLISINPVPANPQTVAEFSPWLRRFLLGASMGVSKRGLDRRKVTIKFRTEDGTTVATYSPIHTNVGDRFYVEESILLNAGMTLYIDAKREMLLMFREPDRECVIVRAKCSLILAFRTDDENAWLSLKKKLTSPVSYGIELSELRSRPVKWVAFYTGNSFLLPLRAVAAILGADPRHQVRHFPDREPEEVEVVLPNGYWKLPRDKASAHVWKSPPDILNQMLPVPSS